MAFWAKNFGEDTTLKDPKRNFSFIVEFSNLRSSDGPLLWFAKTAAKPSFAIAAAEHKYLNHTFYYPGSVTWNTISISLVDPVVPDVAATVADFIVQGGYTPPSTPNSLTTMSKAKAAGSMGIVTVKQLDADGMILEEWTLWNSWITDVKFGDTLEYGNDELSTVDIELKYDWARLETKTDGSVGPNTGASTFFDTRAS